MPPRTQYTRSSDGVVIAYQVCGDGPVDLVLLTGVLSNVETLWEEPGLARGFDRLGEFARLVLMDRRGVGMSDRLDRPATPAQDVADIDAVLDAVGSEQAVVYGTAGGALQALEYVVARPDRAKGLILYAGFVRTTWAEDMPWAARPEEREARMGRIFDRWGEGLNTDLLAPSAAGDPQVRVPTLVLHRRDDQLIDVRHSRYIAERIPNARYVELPGRDHLMSIGDAEAIHGEIEEFLTGGPRRSASDRRLLTVLFTDIVDGTARAARVGDARWRSLLSAHDSEVRGHLARFGGRAVKTIGDGFLAVFDGPPSQAVRCASAIADATDAMGVPVRAGLHTGECEVVGDDVAGMAVNIAARVCALAGAGEVLASGTTYGTVVGSGLPFRDAGMHELKGVPGHWPVFRVR